MSTLVKVRIWTAAGGRLTVDAAPTPVPGLVIHGYPGSDLWSVTHVASGAAVAKARDPETALDLAIRLADVADWTLPATQLRRDRGVARRRQAALDCTANVNQGGVTPGPLLRAQEAGRVA